MNLGLKIILLLLLSSAAIAFVGDNLGRLIGKKRLSLFGLRPLHTATGISIISGIIIAVTTLGITLLLSSQVRTAFFGLEELQKSITLAKTELETQNKELEKKRQEQEELEKKLSLAKQEIALLEKSKEKLSQEIKVARKGKLLFKIGDTIFSTLISGGDDKEKIEKQLKEMIATADTYVRGLGVAANQPLISLSPTNFTPTLSFFEEAKGEYAVLLQVSQNTLWGEEILVHYEIVENKLIYKKGKEIASGNIAHSTLPAVIEEEIKLLLASVHQIAKTAGVLPDPTGSLGSVPYAQIFNLAKKIKDHGRHVALSVLAKDDLYTIGPLEIEFKIYYK